MGSFVRRAVALVSVIGVGVTIAIVAVIWTGPLTSGAWFLSWPTRRPPVSHDLPPSYRPKHKGHVDLSTGLYIREDEDLVLSRTPPFALTRTYLSGDRVSRQFGVGTTNNAEWYLIGDAMQFQWAELILANGGRIHFDRISRGTSYQNALFLHRATPTGFYGSRLGWTGFRWMLRFQDGSLAIFEACAPGTTTICSLIQLRDQDGHVLRFQRDRTGVLQRIEAPAEWIAFTYDRQKRVTRAQADSGRRVDYAYDSLGRLIRVATSDGIVRSYTYGPHDEMLTIREPGWFIENTYDESGRVTQQATHADPSGDDRHPDAEVIAFAYTFVQGAVTETDVREYDGTHTLYRFNARHYPDLEIHDATGKNPVMVSIDRDPTGHFATAVTVRCTAQQRRITRTAPVDGTSEEGVKQRLMVETCSSAETVR